MLVLITAGFSYAENTKVAPELHVHEKPTSGAGSEKQALGGPMLDVIIQFRHDRPLDRHIRRVLALGGKHTRSLGVIHAGVFRVPAQLVAVLAQNPDVLYISPDRKNRKFSDDYLLPSTNGDLAQQLGYDGTGVGVAIIDSGVRVDHPDLADPITGASRVVYSESFVPGLDAIDQYGHGTHVAGLVAGNGSSSGHVIQGIAPHANIIDLRVLDADGSGADSAVIAAIGRAIELKSIYNIGIINLSLGRGISESYTQDPLCQAVEQAWQAGIVVVVAAGNSGRDNSLNTDGYGTIGAPGNDPYVITVGATNTHGTATTADDTIASYSSKGPSLLDHVVKPDLVAPGNLISSLIASGSTLDSTYPTDEVSPADYSQDPASPKQYFVLSGTSMATPVVSGAAALMLQKDPTLTPDQVKARLMKNAVKLYPPTSLATDEQGNSYNSQYDIFTVGAGYLDIYHALTDTDLQIGTALSPLAVQDSNGNFVLQADPSSFWSNSVIWGNSVVWGNSVIWGNSLIWGNSVIWGDSSTSGYSVIWGNSVIRGNGTSESFSSAGNYDRN